MEKKSPFMSALNELMGNQPIGEETSRPAGRPSGRAPTRSGPHPAGGSP